MLKRIIKWAFVLSLLLFLFVFIGVPLLVNTEAGKKQMADDLSSALSREVAIGGLNVGFFFTSLDVTDLHIANPEGYPEGLFLDAGSVHFDIDFRRILDGKITGSLSGERLKVHIIRKDGGTNLDGFGSKHERARKPRKPDAPPPPPPDPEDEEEGTGVEVDLALLLKDCTLTIEDLDKGEKLVVDGVGLEMHFSNREETENTGLTIRIASIDNQSLRVKNIVLDAKRVGKFLNLEQLSAELDGGGRLEGSGRLRVHDGNDWNVKLDVSKLGIEADMVPFVGAVYPFASAAGGQLDGQLDGTFELSGSGLTWASIKPTLLGTGQVTLTKMRLPEGSALSLVSRAAGGPGGALELNSAGAAFAVENGWLSFHRLSARSKKARYDLEGKVSLDGRLDLAMDILPLVKQFNRGAYRKVSRYVKTIPIRIEGTTTRPKFKGPKPESLIKGLAESLLENGLGKALDKIGRKKKR